MIVLNNMIRGASIARPLFDNRKCNPLAAPVVGSIVSGAGSLLGSLFGGLFGSSAQDKANATNLQIAREQMAFNRDESQKNRDWQEYMYGLSYDRSTALAQAAQLRAAGLNPQLGSIQAGQGQSFSGAQASYDNIPTQQPVTGMSDAFYNMGNGLQSSVNSYFANKETNANTEQIKALSDNIVQQTTNLRLSYDSDKFKYDMLKEMRGDILHMQYWNTQNAMYQSFISEYQKDNTWWQTRELKYKMFNIYPLQTELYHKQIGLAAAQTFRELAQGNLSLTEAEDLLATRGARVANLAAQSWNYYAQGQGALMQGDAAQRNATTNQQELQYKKDSGLYEATAKSLNGSAYNSYAQGNLARTHVWKERVLLPFVKEDLQEHIEYLKSMEYANYMGASSKFVDTLMQQLKGRKDNKAFNRVTKKYGNGPQNPPTSAEWTYDVTEPPQSIARPK